MVLSSRSLPVMEAASGPQPHARRLLRSVGTQEARAHLSGGWGSGDHPLHYLLYFPVLLFQIIKKALSEEKRVSTKTSAADLVTETDHLVEDLIISELQKKFPSHRWVCSCVFLWKRPRCHTAGHWGRTGSLTVCLPYLDRMVDMFLFLLLSS